MDAKQNARISSSRRTLVGASGALLGASLGIAFVLLAGAAVAFRPTDSQGAVLDATHLPPLLTMPNERVELRYDVHCGGPGEESDTACDAVGTVFVRPGRSGPYRPLPLSIDRAAAEGRYAALVPSVVAGAVNGFAYYAVFESEAADAKLTLPAAGPDAAQQSRRLERAIEVRLGAHTFDAVQQANARVVESSWGDGPGRVGLEQGRNLTTPIGGSSFDIDARGVHLLDQVHRRVLRWRAGASQPAEVQLSVDGTLADLAVAPDGTMHVLETATAERNALVRTFSAGGAARGVSEVADRTASQIRMADNGPVVLEQPSGQWMPTSVEGLPLSETAQRAGARPGRAVPGGSEVVVLRRGNEIRAAIVGSTAVRGAWRVLSDTPVAEVQLAEPLGNRLVLVARLYEERSDEFVVLLLGPSGLERRFSVTSADWAETAPLSRFRLHGSSVYQLGSTPARLFVDRFDLEVK